MTPRRVLLIAALAIGAGLAGVVCVVQGAAGVLAVRDPQKAANWGIANGDALSALAEHKLIDTTQPDRLIQAGRYARAALDASPLDPRAVRVLALAEEIGGDHVSPLRLMDLGDELSRRDPITQVWLFEHALEGHAWLAASQHADALMRGEFMQGPLTAAMVHAMAEPGALGPFVDRLAADPGWRRPFMSSLTWAADDRHLPARVLALLAASKAPPTDEETGRVIERFVSEGDYQGARALWVGALPRGAAAPATAIYNGSFANLATPPPFNWRLNQSEAAETGFTRADDGRAALHVQAQGATSEALAEEALVLPPGSYRLSVSAKVEAGPTGEVYAWRLACAESQGSPLAEIRQTAGTVGWRTLVTGFQVPAAGCGAQWLRLYALPREGFQPAEAWFSAIGVSPVGVAEARPNGRSG